MSRIKTFLWYDDQAEEAARYYVSLFDDGRIHGFQHYGSAGPGEPGSVMTVDFTVGGHELVALNGGPEFRFTEAISLSVECDEQVEVDRLWEAFVSDGGAESQCGWLKDKYGLSWQIVPAEMPKLLGGPDQIKAERAMKAMLSMTKLDINALRDAYEGR